MANTRMIDMLKDAAAAFADGRSPFETSWLSDRGVTLDEYRLLADQVSYAVSQWAETLETMAMARKVSDDLRAKRSHQ
jgi:hypothetical protein